VVDLTASGNVTVAGTTTLAALNASGNVSFDGGTFVFNEAGADRDARFEGDTDANLLFLDASTDRVGIGTSLPNRKLTILESALPQAFAQFSNVTGSPANLDTQQFSEWNANTAVSGLTFSPSDPRLITFTVTQNNEIALRADNLALIFTDRCVFYTIGGIERMRLDSSGNLGIGNTAPAEQVTAGTVNDRVGLYQSGTTTQLRLGSSNAGASMMVLQYNRSTGTYQFSEGTNGNTGSPDITVLSSGNVGIGTSSPLRLLDVVGTGVTDGQLVSNLRIQSNASYNSFPLSGIQFSTVYTSGAATAGVAGIAGGKENTIDGDEAGFLALFSRPAGGNITERARITSGGTFAIGTTTPATGASLDVNGSIRAKQGIPNSADLSTTGYSFGGDGDTGMFSPVVGGGASNGVLAFYCNNAERLRMTASNASLVSTVDSTAPTLSTNSTMSFELTSNTSLKVVVRGTDGVTRSVSLTLS